MLISKSFKNSNHFFMLCKFFIHLCKSTYLMEIETQPKTLSSQLNKTINHTNNLILANLLINNNKNCEFRKLHFDNIILRKFKYWSSKQITHIPRIPDNRKSLFLNQDYFFNPISYNNPFQFLISLTYSSLRLIHTKTRNK